jgi:hypothetical protein
MNKYKLIISIPVFLIVTYYVYVHFANKKILITEEQKVLNSSENKTSETENVQTENPIPEEKTNNTIKQKVPFIVQAPFGNWKDPVFQNACEEASMIMAMGWINSVSLISAQDAQDKIRDLAVFEDKELGYNNDTSINDIQDIFRKYFLYQNTAIKENIILSDIKDEIYKGNIVLVPVFGRVLGNPNYTTPGPVTHMLVIVGYDPLKKEFITNDTGTRQGKDYRYNENILFSAIWGYPSGSRKPNPPKGVLKKGMIIVQSRKK